MPPALQAQTTWRNSFTLRKDRPARDQALAEATREALAKAQVLATALVAGLFGLLKCRRKESKGRVRFCRSVPG